MKERFELSMLIDSVQKKYAKELGINNKPATILGYVSMTKKYEEKDLEAVIEYTKQKFGTECKIKIVHAHNILPDNLKRFSLAYANHTKIVQAIIYKQ